MIAPRCRWSVSADDPGRLGELLARIAPDGSDALSGGRVFIDGKRVTDPAEPLQQGQRVEIYAAREAGLAVTVLGRRGGLVAAFKPAGIATEPERRGAASAKKSVAEVLGEPEGRLHAASRLDVGVSGVVLFALTAEARDEIERAREEHRLARRYVAIGAGRAATPSGSWDAPVGTRGGQRDARTRFQVAAVLDEGRATGVWPAHERKLPVGCFTLLALSPATGRMHQLRVHAASAGCPLLGDARYGGPERLVFADGRVEALRRIALHCAWVRLGSWEARAPAPEDLVRHWAELGGEEPDWSRAEDDAVMEE